MSFSYQESLPSTSHKPKTFWSELKSLLLNDTHFRDYLPLMNENQKQKVVRIHNDVSYVTSNAHDDYWSFLPKREPWDPSYNLIIVWIIIVCLVNSYFLYEAGIVMTFGATIWQQEMKFTLTYTLSWIFLCIYVADILVTLNTGYYTDGILILDRKRIISRYLKTLLIIDLPVITIIFFSITIEAFGINYAKIYLLTKLIQMNRVDYIIQRKLQIYRTLKAIYLILRILWIVMWISNIMGLIFYAIDYYILINGIYTSQYCWLVNSLAFSNIIDEPWEIQYLYVLYWGVNTVTTISYGDIAPNNPIEVVYVLGCFVVAFVIYSYVLNQIVQTVLWAKEVRENYRNQLVIINTFMRRKDVSQELQQKTTEYLEFLYEEESLRDQNLEKEMIDKLPENLKMVLLRDAYKLFYLKLDEIFLNFPNQFITQLLNQITQTKLSNNQVIFDQGQDSNLCLYMLSKGTIHLVISYGKSKSKKHILKTIDKPCRTFGELQFVTGSKRRYSAVSEDVSALYYIQRGEMLEILKKSMKCNEYFCNMIQEIEVNKKYFMINYFCPKCDKNHPFEECPQLFPEIKPDIVFKSEESSEVKDESITRVTIKRRKPIHPQYRSNREAANEIDKYAPKLEIQQIIRFKLERRMALLQFHINTMKDKFEVDIYHDWEYYKPEDNPSNLFQIINKSSP